MKLYNINFKKSYLVNWNKGPWGSLGSKIGVRGCVVWNASRANGMRGMAQRISTTPSRSSWKTQHSTQTQRHCGPTTKYIRCCCVSYIVSCVYILVYTIYSTGNSYVQPCTANPAQILMDRTKRRAMTGWRPIASFFPYILLLLFFSSIISLDWQCFFLLARMC